MKRRIVVTGSASGIGLATAERLRAAGHEVIGVDLRDAEIIADLATAEGRETMIGAVRDRMAGGLDGVVASAGLEKSHLPAETLAVNYFGSVATIEGLRPLLLNGVRPRAVAIASTAALYPGDAKLIELCLAGKEDEALAMVRDLPGLAYVSSKVALCRWTRRSATLRDWAGSGILLNTVAPGVTRTPMSAPRLSDPALLEEVSRSSPSATGSFAEPAEIAELIDYLLCCEGTYLVGQVIFIDGGADALLRPDLV